jgi:hypothetical protein
VNLNPIIPSSVKKGGKFEISNLLPKLEKKEEDHWVLAEDSKENSN